MDRLIEDLKTELDLVKTELEAIKANQISGDQKVQLSGTIAQAQQDVIRRAIDEVINIIGADDISLFLPMWETDGVYKDLLRPDLKFIARGSVEVGEGPWGPCVSLGSQNGHIEQQPLTSVSGNGSTKSLSGITHKIAVRLEAGLSGRVRLVTLFARRLGEPYPRLKVSIYNDAEGKPGSPVRAWSHAPHNAVPGTLYGSSLTTVYRDIGVPLDAPVDLDPSSRYWLVVEYVGDGTADADNCLQISTSRADGNAVYDGGESQTAYFDGTSWTVTAKADLCFALYHDVPMGDHEMTLITTARLDTTLHSGTGTLFRLPVRGESNSGYLYGLQLRGRAWATGYNVDPDAPPALVGRFEHTASVFPGDVWHSYAYSLGPWGKDRFRLSIDGNEILRRPASWFDSIGNLRILPPGAPWQFGRTVHFNGIPAWYWRGEIGPTLLVKRALTPDEIGRIHSLLFVLRQGGDA